MKASIYAIGVTLLLPFTAYPADDPAPKGVLINGVEWSIGDNAALPLARGDKAAYLFSVNKGKVSLGVDGTTIGNIVAPSTVLLVGKNLDLLTKFSNGIASSGTVQRVTAFKTNVSYSSLKQGILPATFPLARFDSPRSFAFAIEGVQTPDKRPLECKDPSTSYVRLILDGLPIQEPANSDARFSNNTGYMGKARSIDWAIAGPQTCQFSVIFTLVDE
jgi:hypothetical protein